MDSNIHAGIAIMAIGRMEDHGSSYCLNSFRYIFYISDPMKRNEINAPLLVNVITIERASIHSNNNEKYSLSEFFSTLALPWFCNNNRAKGFLTSQPNMFTVCMGFHCSTKETEVGTVDLLKHILSLWRVQKEQQARLSVYNAKLNRCNKGLMLKHQCMAAKRKRHNIRTHTLSLSHVWHSTCFFIVECIKRGNNWWCLFKKHR